jgi:hypothetical protein
MEQQYYYIDKNRQQQGPILITDFLKHEIIKTTLVWKQGMDNWQMADSIPELMNIFQSNGILPPPIPPPSLPPFQETPVNFGHIHPPRHPKKPNNYFAWSIISFLFLCVPTGIIALIYSNKVDTLWSAKDYSESVAASRQTSTWCILSSFIGFILWIVILSIVFQQ